MLGLVPLIPLAKKLPAATKPRWTMDDFLATNCRTRRDWERSQHRQARVLQKLESGQPYSMDEPLKSGLEWKTNQPWDPARYCGEVKWVSCRSFDTAGNLTPWS